MSSSTRAVFISYASEDSEAGGRIAHALKAAGIEVWFDKSELRGGDAWDRQIRQQIQDCRLFLALISANTEGRDEGYFRREWKLAVERTHDMADGKPFIVPVVIDGTGERGATVPDWFRQVQWIRLPRGEPTPDFSARIASLLGSETDPATTRAPSGGSLVDVQLSKSQHRWPFRRRAPLICLALGIVGVGTYASWHYARRESTPATPITLAGKPLAVLPFIDLTQAHDQEYLADGMSEEILDLLTKIPQLTVIGRTSSFQFKGKNEDLRTVGSKLGAAYVVEGSVRTSGSRVRVTAQLIDARTGSHVWSESYDRQFRDVLALQDQVAASIARELQIVVNASQSAGESPRNPDAYRLYLRGRVAFDRGDTSSLRESQADFEQALALEPTLTRAADGLVLTSLNLVYLGAVPYRTGWQQVRARAEDSLRRDSGSVFAHIALAWVHAYYDYDVAACNQELDAILATPVRDPAALVYSAWIAGAVRRPEVAERQIHQAVVSDPLNPDAFQALGGILRDNGDLAGAERAFRQSLLISPTFATGHLYLAEVLYYRHQLDDALTEVSAESPGAGRQAILAGIQFALGRKSESDALLADLSRHIGEGDAYWIAMAYSMRGEKDRAFEWLDKAFANRDVSLHTAVDPIFAPLREDPRWAAFLQRMSN